MKTSRNQKGFILFIAVAMIPLVGVALLLLSGGTGMLAAEERLAARDAARRNLFASAAAWASVNRGRLAAMNPGEAVSLDLAEFDLKYAACTVTLDNIAEDHVTFTTQVQVNDHGAAKSKHYALSLTDASGQPVIIPREIAPIAATAAPSDDTIPMPVEPAPVDPNTAPGSMTPAEAKPAPVELAPTDPNIAPETAPAEAEPAPADPNTTTDTPRR